MQNYKEVFESFRDHYVPIPLESLGPDPYKTLISVLLSSRTRDEVSLASSLKLFKQAPNPIKLKQLKVTQIEKLIYPVGFYKTKARHISKLAKILADRYNSNVPSTKKDLMTLPGIGIKTANLVLNRAFNKPAIAVDTHVHRISNLLGWVNTKTPEQTEKKLTKILPKIYWPETNRLFVSIGRQFRSMNKLKGFLEKEGLSINS